MREGVDPDTCALLPLPPQVSSNHFSPDRTQRPDPVEEKQRKEREEGLASFVSCHFCTLNRLCVFYDLGGNLHSNTGVCPHP